nr:PREDICTED: uncharacterized protein LOC107077194 [Lepisosteus oculatus]
MASDAQGWNYNTPLDEVILPETRKPIASNLTGKLLEKSFGQGLKTGHRAAAASPKQRLIDVLLSRRRTQRFDQEVQSSNVQRQLEEARERLSRELQALRLQKTHHEFIVPRHQHDEAQSLQARVQRRAESLPGLRAAVWDLREMLRKECEAESGLQIPGYSSKTAFQSLSEVAVEAVEDNLRVSGETDPSSHLQQRRGEEAQADRASTLAMEHLVLQTTSELSKEIALELYNTSKICQALSFELILNSAEEAAPVRKIPGNDDSGDLAQIVLQQQRHRGPHPDQGPWRPGSDCPMSEE